MAKNIEIGGRLHSIATGNVVTGANEVLDDSLGKKQSVVNQETDSRLDSLKDTTDYLEELSGTMTEQINNINNVIPDQTYESGNELADKAFVNSSIATNTGFFKGTYLNVSDIPTEGVKNNDYAFVIVTDQQGDPSYARYKYTVVEGVGSWVYEYTLNNSSFTADQWAAIQSGITAALVSKLKDLPLNSVLTERFNSKVDKVPGKGLSTNDYTNEDQDKLQGLPSGEELMEDLEDIGDEIAGIKHDMNPDYKQEYFTIESLVDNNIIRFKASNDSIAKIISVSTDGGTTWTNKTSTTSGVALATLNTGDKLLIKGNYGSYGNSSDYNYFESTGNFKVYGNIMSLLYGDDFVGKTSIPYGGSYTYKYLFRNCTGLVDSENLILPATTLYLGCYQQMFYGCTSLKEAPELPATTIASACYQEMFYNCTSLKEAPELPATTLAVQCYNAMFKGCTSLKEAPKLPATTLDKSCYNSMFWSCTSLKEAPELPATTLAQSCYNGMFYNCTSLKEAPELPATTLVTGCYSSMFYNCSSLKKAPELPATTLVQSCYNGMFTLCTSLKEVTCLATNISVPSCTTNWLSNVAATGTFITADNPLAWTRGMNGIPEGWKVYKESESGIVRDADLNPVKDDIEEIKESLPRDYSNEYLTIESLADNNTISFKASNDSIAKIISVSTDGGTTWTNKTSTTSGVALATLNTGDKLLIKGTNDAYANSNYYNYFVSTGNFKVYGNIMSIIYGDNFSGQTALSNVGYNFNSLFVICTTLVNAENLILPATKLTATRCYFSMFNGCTSLTTAPELPATTLAQGCYYWMFKGCTSLEVAPKLPATTLTTDCYLGMFQGCTSLKEVFCLATNISANSCTNEWLSNVAATGTFITADNAPGWTRDGNGIPTNWTVCTQSDYEVVRKYQLANYIQSSTVKSVVVLTQTEFDALTTYDNNTEYNII